MGINTRIQLWMVWVGFTLFLIGQVLYTELFYQNVSAELQQAYSLIDAQLSIEALMAKYIFAVCESLCFSIVLYYIREIASKDAKLNAAYGIYFAMSMINVTDAVCGKYFSAASIKIEYAYAVCVVLIGINEYKRYKNRTNGHS